MKNKKYKKIVIKLKKGLFSLYKQIRKKYKLSFTPIDGNTIIYENNKYSMRIMLYINNNGLSHFYMIICSEGIEMFRKHEINSEEIFNYIEKYFKKELRIIKLKLII